MGCSPQGVPGLRDGTFIPFLLPPSTACSLSKCSPPVSESSGTQNTPTPVFKAEVRVAEVEGGTSPEAGQGEDKDQ